MNLPDASIAHEGFFVTHFFTVRDQEKSKDFYVRIPGGKLIKSENPCYIKRSFSIPVAVRRPISRHYASRGNQRGGHAKRFFSSF